jgi:membrane-associated phospholipid phosphatase
LLKIRYDEPSLFFPIMMTLLIAGLVLTARLKLNAHTMAQVAAGFFLGLTVSIFGTIFI